ncbi:MAG TPA: signal peptide peptidase SppA [Fulvivirga sp.]|nr:signal peptide peptidase SppA [Fulvivirga sp.]
MNFLKNILSTLVALLLFSIVGILIVIGTIGALSEKQPVVVEANSILHLKLNKPISEQEVDNPFDKIGIFSGEESSIGLIKLKKAILNAETDDNIKGIYLELNYFMGGMSTLEEVRTALAHFKTSGKFIVAYSEYLTEGAYYLASVADAVYLNPEGELELNGLNANVTFYKGLFDKLGIEVQVFRVGDFKSAVEPFIRKDLSEENALQLSAMLNDLNNTMLSSISASRNIDLDTMKGISKSMEVRDASDALKLKLIDGLLYEDEVLAILEEKTATNDLTLITYGKYKDSFSTYKISKNEIAVIVADGDIVSGKGDAKSIGSEKFAKQIREAREDDDVKAIVMRINSPGGSYLASDVMWREISLAAKRKPVIASMSNYAASGGYYLAMACDTIVAQPNTITGSIGIFGMLFNLEGLLNDKLGITNDEVSTGDYSGMLTVSRGLTDAEKSIIQNSVERNYETFVAKAAQGRGMTVDEIKAIASGRVWTGNQAKQNGLVDILGSFDDAISIAAEKAGVTLDYKVKYYPEQKEFFERLLEDISGETSAKMLKTELGDLYPYFEKTKRLKDLRGVQARLPFELEIN